MPNPDSNRLQANILVVDDSLPSLRALLAILRKQGFEARGAPDGSTALMMIEAEPPDLILLDVNLPHMNGYELCRQLKSQTETQDIPVIFISGLIEIVDKVKGFAVGGVDYISKPFQVEEAIARVETHLTLRTLQQTLKAQNAQLQQEIIERKRAEAELQKAHDELELRVKGRTVELSKINTQLEEEIAERTRIEAAVRESEEHFRKIFEHSPLGQALVGSDFRPVQVNTMLCQMLGYSESELTTLTFPEFTHPEDIAKDVQLVQQLFNGEISYYKIEKRYLKKNKEILWAMLTVTVIRDEAGNPFCALGMVEDITERKQDGEALKRYAERLQVLHEIDQAILAAQSPQEIAQAALSHIRQLVPCQRASVVLFDFGANEAVVIAVNINSNTRLGAGERISLDAIGPTLDLRQGHHHIVNDILTLAKPSGSDEQLLAEGVRSYVNIPLISRGGVIGSLNLGANTPGKFTTEHVDIAGEIAAQLAVAIIQARLFEAEAQRRQEAETLRKATAALTSALALDQVLDSIMTHVKVVVPYDSSALFLHEGQLLRVVAGRGFASPENVVGHSYPVEEDVFFDEIQQTGRPIILGDAQTDPRFLHWGDSGHVRGWMGVPLIAGGAVMGYLTLDSRRVIAYGEAEANLAQAFANQAAIAIENARLFEAEQHQHEIAETLGKVASVVNSSLNLNEVLDWVLVELEMIIPYDSASIMLLENNFLHMVAGRGFADYQAVMAVSLPLADLPLAQKVIRQQQPMIIPDTEQEPLFNAAARGSTNLRCLIAVPLISRNKVIGLLTLDSWTPHRYSNQDADVAFRLAHQAAIAIENARLYERVQHYTAELEQRVIDRTRELSVLYDVTAVASEALDLQTTLERSLEQVLAAMQSDAGLIHLLDETKKVLNLVVQQGLALDFMAPIAAVLSNGSLGKRLIEHGEPLIIPDITSVLEMAEIYAGPPQMYIGLPIRARGTIMGILSIIREATQPQFNVEEMTLLTAIADQVGVVVESARLRQQAEQAAVLEERARLARELHDSVTQLLYSMNLFAKSGRNAYNFGNMAEVNNCLVELGDSAQQALKEMRLLVYELRPPVLEQDGLVGALQHRLDAVEGRAGIMTQLLTNQVVDLPGRIEQELYHIALEALNNALKHANATAVTVKIEAGHNQIKLEVIDNGSGFDLDQMADRGGLGLISMRQRTERLGGELTSHSMPGHGTTIRVQMEVP